MCSGNAIQKSLREDTLPVYPRVLGERNAFVRAVRVIHGLSPCARGTLLQGCKRIKERRFIPVCSGNANAKGFGDKFDPVYPRVLGER